MAISMVRAKALCSAGELALVKASTRQEIGAHTAARLRQKETRARKLRDKWRDQATGQKRSAQAKAGSRDAGANKNSAEKAELFDEVLGRYTAQLAKTEAAGESAGPMGRRRSTKTSRSRTHRAARADVRGELKEAKRTLKAKTKPAAVKAEPVAAKSSAKPVKKKRVTVAAKNVSGSKSATAVTKGADTGPKAKRTSRPMAADATAIVAGRKAQGLHVTKQGQIKASADAKQRRLKTSGMIRIQKNRSAANKRNQGRRDSR